MQGNLLKTLEPLSVLTGLQVILAACNGLEDLSGLGALPGLRKLDIGTNAIATLDGVAHIRSSAVLSELTTTGNPMDMVRGGNSATAIRGYVGAFLYNLYILFI